MMEATDSALTHTYTPRAEPSRPSKARRRWIRIAACAGAIGIIALCSCAWLAARAATLKSELESASSLLPRLKDELLLTDAASAEKTVDQMQTHTAAARQIAKDPLWIAAGSLPWLGANFQAAGELATSADDVARLGAAPLVSVFSSLDWETLAPSDTGINLDPLMAAQPKLSSAAHAVSQSAERLSRIDAEALFPQVSGPLIQAREQLESLRGNLDAAANFSSVAPNMMGSSGAKRYLLLIQNNAEVRASGGIPGALAVLTINDGKLTLSSQTSAGALGAFKPKVAADPEQEAIYSARLGTFMQDVNLTPDFPTSARIAQQMWEKKTGQSVDGILSIDPVALGYILEATGPVHLTDPQLLQMTAAGLPTELTGKNVIPTLLADVYSKISDPQLQDVYFADVARATFEALSAGTSDPKVLLDGLRRGVDDRRVLVWSRHLNEQILIQKYPLSGSISGPSVAPAQFGVYFNDGTGAKMDYYMKRTVQLVKECTDGEYSQVKVRVTSTNNAPRDAATSLPPYVTGDGAFGVPAGTVQTNVTVYGPSQANVETATIAGKKIPFAPGHHSGRPVGTVTTALAPGESKTLDLTFSKIVQHTEPVLVSTPTVQSTQDLILKPATAECSPVR